MKSFLPFDLDPPIDAYGNEDMWVFNWTVAYSKTRLRYLKFSLCVNGVFIPNCRVIGGKIHPPQTRYGKNYFSVVHATSEFCGKLHELLNTLIKNESLPIALEPPETACASWKLESDKLRIM
jgi:hypothetical protein